MLRRCLYSCRHLPNLQRRSQRDEKCDTVRVKEFVFRYYARLGGTGTVTDVTASFDFVPNSRNLDVRKIARS